MISWEKKTLSFDGGHEIEYTAKVPVMGLVVLHQHNGCCRHKWAKGQWYVGRRPGHYEHKLLEAKTDEDAKIEAVEWIRERLEGALKAVE
jgi:hypothetical protein